MKLSLPQQDVYYEQLLYPGEPVYNIGAKVAIEGAISYEVLSRAYIALINQHDAFRSILLQQNDEVAIEFIEEFNSPLQLVDLSREEFAEEAANKYIQEQFRQPFDLNGGEILFRFILIKVNDTFHYLLAMYHHIITDGWGSSLMFQRLVANYHELMEYGRVESKYPYSYKEFVVDDLQYLNAGSYEQDKQYWKDRFQQLPEALFEKIDKNVAVNKNDRRELIVSRALYNNLESLAKSLGCTTFHIIIALLYLYFGRKHRHTDFTIGLPVLNRGRSAFKKTVGLFMGVSALRVKFSYSDTFVQLVANVKQQLRQDYRHQRFPIGKLVNEIGAFREREQLFNITLSYEKQNYADHFAGTHTTVIPLTHGAERVALTMAIREYDDSRDVKIDFDYNLNYFDEDAIAGVVTHFEQLLPKVCEHPEFRISTFIYLTEAEQRRVVHEFNNTSVDYAKDSTFLSLFQRQVIQREDEIAVWDDSVGYTYAELDSISDRIAMHLCGRLSQQQLIGVLMPRSPALVAVLLGVLKSGNAYIPMDPDFPAERLKYIAEHSKAACIIGVDNLIADVPFVSIDEILNERVASCQLPHLKYSDAAYVIYTSGSTGNPKGVVIGHQSLLNFLLSMSCKPGLAEGQKFFSVTTQSFDISMLEFFGPLVSGGSVYIAAKSLLFEPAAVIDKILAIKPAIIQATPSFYQSLFNAGWQGDKSLKVLCGGDLLTASLAAKLLDGCAEIWNMYGPTEATIWSSIKHLQSPADAPNVGKPINNTQFYILDECLQLLPVGFAGDIYIGGDGLAKGYHRDEVLTNDKFIINPFNENEKIYKTGDVGKWNREGEIEFLGRSDHQVKIRGYRIELGEIETKINHLPFVKDAVVVAKKKAAQEAFLVAYVIPADNEFDATAIIKALQKDLPEYMIPYSVIEVEEFPLTPNKKIDRKLLSSREIEQPAGQHENVLPETYLQSELCRLFKEALEWKGEISIADNFFSMGGHSLNAMKLVNQVQKQLGYQLALKDVFDHPTTKALADHLKEKVATGIKGIQPVAEQARYSLTPSQYAIWLASQDEHRNSAYNLPMVYEVHGKIDIEILERAFADVIMKYEILRTNFIEIDGIPYQQVKPPDKLSFKVDVTGQDIDQYVNEAFNLETDLLVRAGLFSAGDKMLLAFCSHHIIIDGWSVELLIKEIAANNDQRKLPAFQFKDYVSWLSDVAAERKEINEKFWNNYLLNYQWKPVSATGSSAGEYQFTWDSGFYESMKLAVRKQNTTLHTFLLSAFAVLLSKLHNENDLCIGTVNSGRTVADLHGQIGMFVKTLPLRAKIEQEHSFNNIVKAIHTDLLKIDAHQDIPEALFNTIRPDVLFVVQPPSFNYESFELAPDILLTSYRVYQHHARLPLLVNFIEGYGSLKCAITYDLGYYTKEKIEIMTMKYEKLIEQVIGHSEIQVVALDTSLTFEESESIDIEFSF